ncbi:hypothetical protein D3C72_430130 [compost metagenome]
MQQDQVAIPVVSTKLDHLLHVAIAGDSRRHQHRQPLRRGMCDEFRVNPKLRRSDLVRRNALFKKQVDRLHIGGGGEKVNPPLMAVSGKVRIPTFRKLNLPEELAKLCVGSVRHVKLIEFQRLELGSIGSGLLGRIDHLLGLSEILIVIGSNLGDDVSWLTMTHPRLPNANSLFRSHLAYLP